MENTEKEIIDANIFSPLVVCFLHSQQEEWSVELMKILAKSTYSIIGFDI